MENLPYKVYIPATVEKQLDKIKGKLFDRITYEILKLRENPRPIGSKKLTNEEGYRVRIGSYRILYLINDKQKLVEIYKISHRREAYR